MDVVLYMTERRTINSPCIRLLVILLRPQLPRRRDCVNWKDGSMCTSLDRDPPSTPDSPRLFRQAFLFLEGTFPGIGDGIGLSNRVIL